MSQISKDFHFTFWVLISDLEPYGLYRLLLSLILLTGCYAWFYLSLQAVCVCCYRFYWREHNIRPWADLNFTLCLLLCRSFSSFIEWNACLSAAMIAPAVKLFVCLCLSVRLPGTQTAWWCITSAAKTVTCVPLSSKRTAWRRLFTNNPPPHPSVPLCGFHCLDIFELEMHQKVGVRFLRLCPKHLADLFIFNLSWTSSDSKGCNFLSLRAWSHRRNVQGR